MPETVRVRIAVAVNDLGAWSAAGWQDPASDENVMREARNEVHYGTHPVNGYWLTADLPIPTVKEIEASVEVDDGE